jgi:hypothetical protein
MLATIRAKVLCLLFWSSIALVMKYTKLQISVKIGMFLEPKGKELGEILDENAEETLAAPKIEE